MSLVFVGSRGVFTVIAVCLKMEAKVFEGGIMLKGRRSLNLKQSALFQRSPRSGQKDLRKKFTGRVRILFFGL